MFSGRVTFKTVNGTWIHLTIRLSGGGDTCREPTNSVFIKANALKFKDSLDLQNIQNLPRCKAASALAWPPNVVSDKGDINGRGGRNVYV